MSEFALPEGIQSGDEIAIRFEREDDQVRMLIELDGVSIAITHDVDKAHLVPWLVAALPQTLDEASAAMEAAEKEEA